MIQALDKPYLQAVAALPDGWDRIVAMLHGLADDRETAQAIAKATVAQIEPLKRRCDELLAANNREVDARRALRRELDQLREKIAQVDWPWPDGLLPIYAADDAPTFKSILIQQYPRRSGKTAAAALKAGSGAKVARPSEGSDALEKESAPSTSSAGDRPSAGSNPAPANRECINGGVASRFRFRIAEADAEERRLAAKDPLPILPNPSVPAFKSKAERAAGREARACSFETRKAELERAIAYLKPLGVLVEVVDRKAQIRKYRVTAKAESLFLEQVIAHAIAKGMSEKPE